MRRTERYTVPFPPPEQSSPESLYTHLRTYTLWRRLYLRVSSLFRGSSLAETVRQHELKAIRRRLREHTKEVVQTDIPALLPGFHQHFRPVLINRERMRVPLHELTVERPGQFLIHLLRELDIVVFRELEAAATLSEDLLNSTETTLPIAHEAVRVALNSALESHYHAIRGTIEPRWIALRALYLLSRFDTSPMQPSMKGGATRIPLRVIRSTVQEFYQLLQLVLMKADPAVLEIGWQYLRSTTRMNMGTPPPILESIQDFIEAVQLEDLVYLAWDDPFLQIPSLTLRSDWWKQFSQNWHVAAGDRTGAILFQRRLDLLEELVTELFEAPLVKENTVPPELYPSSTAYAIRLAGSPSFMDTRRLVTQLVIDAKFHNSTTRTTLHQAALQVDQALEQITALLGDGKETRGTVGEEMHRIRRRTGNNAVGRRQLITLFEAHRQRLRSSLEGLSQGLIVGGEEIARAVIGKEGTFEYRTITLRTAESALPTMELLEYVARYWQPLGKRLRALQRMEFEL